MKIAEKSGRTFQENTIIKPHHPKQTSQFSVSLACIKKKKKKLDDLKLYQCGICLADFRVFVFVSKQRIRFLETVDPACFR